MSNCYICGEKDYGYSLRSHCNDYPLCSKHHSALKMTMKNLKEAIKAGKFSKVKKASEKKKEEKKTEEAIEYATN